MHSIERLLEIMARLRDPQTGCPWDREQTFSTIAPHTVEEAYEVADAIARGDMRELVDELGDLLFQVAFYAQMAREAGEFEFDDVVAAIVDKMIRRHPHVFAAEQIESAEAQSVAWEQHKAAERRAKHGDGGGVLDSIPGGLPPMLRALKMQRKAAGVGFDWPNHLDVVSKLHEELRELEHAIDTDEGSVEEEIGDLLFTCANFARHVGVDPDTALRHANNKFERRFRYLERALSDQGSSPEQSNLKQMDALWERAKREP